MPLGFYASVARFFSCFERLCKILLLRYMGLHTLITYLHLEQPFMHIPRHGYCMVKILEYRVYPNPAKLL